MRTLTNDDLAAQHAVELPDREMMLITVIVAGNNIEILNNVDVDVAATVCANVQALTGGPTGGPVFDCTAVTGG